MASMLTRGSNQKKRRNAAAWTINLPEKRIGTMELKAGLTKVDIQSILRMSKLLSDVSNDFKMYHFAFVDQLEGEAEEVAEQEILDQHEINSLGPTLCNCHACMLTKFLHVDRGVLTCTCMRDFR